MSNLDILKVIKYQPTDGEGRSCAVCGAPMAHLTNGFDQIDKCIQCGYSFRPTGNISEQHAYDFKFTITTATSNKKAFFEIYQPLDELLFNSLISAGRNPKEARVEIIVDLGLKDESLEYFNQKLNFLGDAE